MSVPPSPAPELRKRLPAARRRSQLLEVALDRFAASGFHGTSMEEIADAAGVTKPVLYQHFGSKRTLYLELLETVGEELLRGRRHPGRGRGGPLPAGPGRLSGLLPVRRGSGPAPSRCCSAAGPARPTSSPTSSRTVEASVAATIAAFIDADIEDSHRDLLGYAIVGLGEVTARLWVSRHDEATKAATAATTVSIRPRPRCWPSVWPIWSGPGLRGLPGGARP